MTVAASMRQRIELGAEGVSTSQVSRYSAAALLALRQETTYQQRESYVAAVSSTVAQIDLINRLQDEFAVSLGAGVEVRQVNYANSQSLSDFALGDSRLADLIGLALADFPKDAGFVAFSVTSPQDLLTALIAARLIHRIAPAAHLCLADHGYENYSLQPYLAALKAKGAFLQFFDTIVEAKSQRDGIVSALLAEIERGAAPRAYLGVAEITPAFATEKPPLAASFFDSFTPRPVYWMRISANRCYWNRCAFCAQNSKHVGKRSPEKAEVGLALARIGPLVAAGIQDFILSDEALSPAMLRALSDGIIASGRRFRWSCRSKVELAHDRDLFKLMRKAGCTEVLFGIETTSPRLQQLMGKHASGVDDAFLRRMFRHMDECDVAPHINLMLGFPGDTLAEADASVEFAAEVLASARGATYTLNRFVLFPDTPVQQSPAAFGIQLQSSADDMPPAHAFKLHADIARETRATLERWSSYAAKLNAACGLGDLAGSTAGAAATALYLDSGHGFILKTAAPIFTPGHAPCASS